MQVMACGVGKTVKASYPKASILKARRVIFNIKGNDYRLVAAVQYRAGALAIRVLRQPCGVR
jgi:mRNA interferase HigB